MNLLPVKCIFYQLATFAEYKIDQKERLNYSDELNSIGLEVGRWQHRHGSISDE